MQGLRNYRFYLSMCTLYFLIGFYFFGYAYQFAIAYMAVFVFLTFRTLNISSKKRMKLMMIFSYGALLFLQLSFIGELGSGANGLEWFRFFCVMNILAPFIAERFFITSNYASFYFPSVQEISTVSFNELKNSINKVLDLKANIQKSGKALSVQLIKNIVTDFPASFRYVNNGSLTPEYFDAVRDSLDDPNIYIVISDTGSPACEFLSIFTKKQYNHASLSFDADLKTIISYNGGDRLYPPGLNPEMIMYFCKKPDASVIVYRMEATRAQKEMILKKVNQINQQGSSYNILGLALKYSHKSNILFCSQFVYKMLEYAGLLYFTKNDMDVRPMDFVELDVRRKLHFAYEILFSQDSETQDPEKRVVSK